MGLVIKKNVDNIQTKYINSIIRYFMNKKFSYDYDSALNTAMGIYEKMIQELNDLVGSISDRISQFPKFHKGYPIYLFKTSNSTWYFAYMRNDNSGNIVVFDMGNSNQDGGHTFMIEEVQKSLDFMQMINERFNFIAEYNPSKGGQLPYRKSYFRRQGDSCG